MPYVPSELASLYLVLLFLCVRTPRLIMLNLMKIQVSSRAYLLCILSSLGEDMMRSRLNDSNVRSRSKRRQMMQPSREGRNRLQENCVCRKVRMVLICSVVVRKLSDRTPTRGACRHGRNQPWRHWNTQSYRQGNIHAI